MKRTRSKTCDNGNFVRIYFIFLKNWLKIFAVVFEYLIDALLRPLKHLVDTLRLGSRPSNKQHPKKLVRMMNCTTDG